MRFLLIFAKTILWITEFEIAITPRYAKNYSQLRLDRIYWQGEVMRYKLRHYGALNVQ